MAGPEGREAIEMIEIPERFAAPIDRRTLASVDALPLGDYDLRLLPRSAYTRGLTDAMQLAGHRPDTFDAIAMGEGGSTP